MPHFLNDLNNCVLEAIEGLCMERNETIAQLPSNPHVVALKPEFISKTAVAVICGGGSGHEPMHAGFVAPGMLSAAVCGRVFASPPISHVRAAIDYLLSNGAPCVLVLVKRYTGDIINFGAAVESSRQRYGADKVAMAVIGDDVAFGAGTYAGDARGVAGTVLWYRLVTAVAHSETFCKLFSSPRKGQVVSSPLEALRMIADTTSKHIRSMGASLQSCTLPGANLPNAAIPLGEVEMGLGIHGERGSQSIRSCAPDGLAPPPVDEVVNKIIDQILSPKSGGGAGGVEINNDGNNGIALSWVPTADHCASTCTSTSTCTPAYSRATDLLLFVNNLGGTTNLEMGVIVRASLLAIYNACHRECTNAAEKDSLTPLNVALVGSGAVCTSLDMHGFSLTCINITNLSEDLRKCAAANFSFASDCDELTGKGDVMGNSNPSVALLNVLFSVGGLKALFATRSEFASALALSNGPSQAEANAITKREVTRAAAVLHSPEEAGRVALSSDRAALLKEALVTAVSVWNERFPRYNAFDAACGDGDTGTGISMAAEALLAGDGLLLSQIADALTKSFPPIESPSLSSNELSREVTDAFLAVGNTICDNMAGSMGALLAIFINSMVEGLIKSELFATASTPHDSCPLSLIRRRPEVLEAMLECGEAAVKRVIGTAVGDRTFIDVINAVKKALRPSVASDVGVCDWKAMAALVISTVEHSTEAISHLKAKKGRARYLGGREIGTRDPGAEIVGDFIVKLAEHLLCGRGE